MISWACLLLCANSSASSRIAGDRLPKRLGSRSRPWARPNGSSGRKAEARGPGGPGRFVSGRREAKTANNERNCCAGRNQRFRALAPSHWNPWGAKSGDFAGSFVFNGLTDILFRLVPVVSPFKPAANPGAQRPGSKDLDFRTAEMIHRDSGFVKTWLAAAAVLAAERSRFANGLPQSPDVSVFALPGGEPDAVFTGRARPRQAGFVGEPTQPYLGSGPRWPS